MKNLRTVARGDAARQRREAERRRQRNSAIISTGLASFARQIRRADVAAIQHARLAKSQRDTSHTKRDDEQSTHEARARVMLKHQGQAADIRKETLTLKKMHDKREREILLARKDANHKVKKKRLRGGHIYCERHSLPV